jgi:hypothetical protein
VTVTAHEIECVRRGWTGPGGGVRLTRRGRLVLVVLAVLILLAGLWMTAGHGAAAGTAKRHGASPSGRAVEVVTVGARDTLWDIAARNRPAVDPRITVQRIIDLNALPDAIIQPGQRLALPG